MTLRSGFFNSNGGDRLYDSEDLSRYLDGIIGDGCFPNDTGFLIKENPVVIGSNPPSVVVSVGKTYSNGLWFLNDQEYTLDLVASVNPTDMHLLYFCFNTNISGEGARSAYIIRKSGTLAEINAATGRTGLVPAIPADAGGKYYLPLALVYNNSFNTSNQPNHIDDQRIHAGVTGINITAASLVEVVRNALVPVGAIEMFCRIQPPTGWLLCDGMPIPEGTKYDPLRVLLGGNNTPNLQGRSPMGYGGTGTAGALVLTAPNNGMFATGGAATHTLTAGQMPQHRHATDGAANDIIGIRASGGNATSNMKGTAAGHYTYLQSLTTGYAGGNEAHPNVHPYFVANYIIKY